MLRILQYIQRSSKFAYNITYFLAKALFFTILHYQIQIPCSYFQVLSFSSCQHIQLSVQSLLLLIPQTQSLQTNTSLDTALILQELHSSSIYLLIATFSKIGNTPKPLKIHPQTLQRKEMQIFNQYAQNQTSHGLNTEIHLLAISGYHNYYCYFKMEFPHLDTVIRSIHSYNHNFCYLLLF